MGSVDERAVKAVTGPLIVASCRSDRKDVCRPMLVVGGLFLAVLSAACSAGAYTIPPSRPSLGSGSVTDTSVPTSLNDDGTNPLTVPSEGVVTMTAIADYNFDLPPRSYAVNPDRGLVRALPDGLLFTPAGAIAMVMPSEVNQDFKSCKFADWRHGEWYSNLDNYILEWRRLPAGTQVCMKSWQNQPNNIFITLLKVQRPWDGQSATFAVITWWSGPG